MAAISTPTLRRLSVTQGTITCQGAARRERWDSHRCQEPIQIRTGPKSSRNAPQPNGTA